MADEEVVTPPVEETKPEPEAPVVEATQEELPLAADGEAPAPEAKVAETPAEPEAKPDEPKPDWKDKELKAKHRQLQEAKRREQEKDAEIALLRASQANPDVSRETAKPVVTQTDIEAEERKLLAQQKYVEDCNKTAADGEKKFGAEWREAVQNLEVLGGFDPETMSGLLATDDPAKVLFELGKNPDNYHRIMELSGPKRIIEMGKISMQAEAPKKVSNAPPPVSPVGGRAAPAAATMPKDDDSDEAWYKWRQAERKKHRA